MKIIYIHGLDSSENSVKGLLLEEYCRQHYPHIDVIRPDLNDSPDKVFHRLCDYVYEKSECILKPKVNSALNHSVTQTKSKDSIQTLLVGSSLGGYFASLVSNHMNCPALLLNPSTRPHISLRRFLDSTNEDVFDKINEDNNKVIYQTKGGWRLTVKDLAWFESHQLSHIEHPELVYALIKLGDELLDPNVAASFYQAQGVTVELQEGGDHRMSDFKTQLPVIMSRVLSIYE